MAWRWKKRLAADAVGRADDRAGPALDVRHHPVADRLVVVRQVELGDRLAVAGVGPQRLVGMEMVTPMTHGRAAGLRGSGLSPASGSAQLRLVGWRGRLGLDLRRGLVLAQALERGLAHIAVAGPAGELDLGDQFGLRPVHVALPCAARPAGERAVLRLERPAACGSSGATLSRAEAGADPADIDQLAVRDARRPSASGTGRLRSVQPPITTSWPARHLALVQSRCGRTVGRVEPLGDDALELHPAGRLPAPRRRRVSKWST